MPAGAGGLDACLAGAAPPGGDPRGGAGNPTTARSEQTAHQRHGTEDRPHTTPEQAERAPEHRIDTAKHRTHGPKHSSSPATDRLPDSGKQSPNRAPSRGSEASHDL